MNMRPQGPVAHTTGSPRCAGEEWVMTHKWNALYSVCSEKFLSVTQAVICG